MIEYFSNQSTFIKGLFVMAIGIAGVFLVLIIFYFLIKILTKIFPSKT
ncbi:MAG: OadG family protein [Clostridia bacterium]